MTGHKTTKLSDAIRNLIVCDTQFGWNGATTLKLSELLDLQARGWLIEGDENNEFSLTTAGESVVARALQRADEPATTSAHWTAEGQPDPHGRRYDCERAALTLGNLTDDELANAVFLHGNEQPTMADLAAGKALAGIVYLTAAKDRIRWLSRALVDATCKQPLQVGEVQGDALCTELLVHADGLESTAAGDRETGESIEQAIEDGEGYTPDEPQDIAAGLQHDADRAEESAALLRKAAAALAARQPGVQENPLMPYVDSYRRMAKIGSGRVSCTAVADDIERNMAPHAAPPAQGIDLGPGVQAIAIERQRQMATERFTSTHDEQYQRGELAKAAVAYAQLAAMELDAGTRGHIGWLNPPAIWPWEAHWWKPVDARRDLVRAGALIAAQLDLIDQRDAAPGVGS